MKPRSTGGAGLAAEGVCTFLSGLGIARTSVIHLVGRRSLAPLLWLCRHGFDEVALLTSARSPSEPADLLLSLDTRGPAAFDRLTGEMPHVKPGGLIIVRTDRRRRSERELARQLLGRCGFHIERRLQHRRREVFVARREPVSAVAAGR